VNVLIRYIPADLLALIHSDKIEAVDEGPKQQRYQQRTRESELDHFVAALARPPKGRNA
jgi:hypothetical protein